MSSRRKRHGSGKAPVIGTVILAVLIAGGLLGLHIWEQAEQKREALQAAEQDDPIERLTIYHDGRWYELRGDLDTYLVLGLDKESDSLENISEDALLNNLQADFFLLLVADRTSKSYTALHINRDTMAEIPRIGENGRELSPVTQQLALSHTYGSGGKDSCRNTVKAVSRLLYDVPIDHYYAVTMDAIPTLTDLVGGVPVHVEDDLTSIDQEWKPGADITLHGQKALSFVRARKTVADGTNLNRMNRQREYMHSLREQAEKKITASDSFALKLATTLDEYATSDLITTEQAQLAERLVTFDYQGIRTTPGESKMGARFLEFYPDEAELQKLVIELFFEPK